jgi:flagellar basal-body rod protein FlgC
MPVDSILEAARSGLTYERLRLDAASRNIAAANVPVAPGESAPQWRVDGAPDDFGRRVGGDPVVSEQAGAMREVHDPGHPLADKNGQVRYPATDMVQEMTTLMTASRGYEANVRSFNLLRGMMLRALEIGAK